jgi:hypothetical protein
MNLGERKRFCPNGYMNGISSSNNNNNNRGSAHDGQQPVEKEE